MLPPRPPLAAYPAKNGPTVLLVEDDQDTADLLAEVLSQRGYQLLRADSIRSAIEVGRAPFDVLVSDLGLPDGDGHELLRQVRERTGAPAIALTGYGGETEAQRCKAAGFAAHVLKPTSAERLIETIERVLNPSPP